MIMKDRQIRGILSYCKAGIAGAGGLGSNCAHILARCGLGTIVIADYDTVEEANLNRQFFFTRQTGMKKVDALRENIRLTGSETKIIAHDVKLNRDNIQQIFAGCDVVVEALDSAEMKLMLIETLINKMPGTPVVAASGLAGWGNNEAIVSRKIDTYLYIVGDQSSDVSAENPPLAPRVCMVAAMQANIVLEILLKSKTC